MRKFLLFSALLAALWSCDRKNLRATMIIGGWEVTSMSKPKLKLFDSQNTALNQSALMYFGDDDVVRIIGTDSVKTFETYLYKIKHSKLIIRVDDQDVPIVIEDQTDVKLVLKIITDSKEELVTLTRQ